MDDTTDIGEYNFAPTEETKVDGPIKVEDVVPVEGGKVPLPHELDDPEKDANPETETIWIDVGDTWRKDEDVGLFDITVINIFKLEQEDKEPWYEIESKQKPVEKDEDSEQTVGPLVKESITAFAQKAITLDSQGNAGLPPEKRGE